MQAHNLVFCTKCQNILYLKNVKIVLKKNILKRLFFLVSLIIKEIIKTTQKKERKKGQTKKILSY